MTVNAAGSSLSVNAGDVVAKKSGRVTILRFGETYGDAVRIVVTGFRKTAAPDGVYRSGSTVAISLELGVYREDDSIGYYVQAQQVINLYNKTNRAIPFWR